jgi:uncharacterized protein (TIGR02145 family)
MAILVHQTHATMRLIFSLQFILISALGLSQSPALMPYQAIARGVGGQPLINTAVSARFTVHDGSASGTNVWQEVQTVTTNWQGLFTAHLGSVTPLNGVNWPQGDKFMQVELNTGSGFVDMGTQQMVSVPYALHTEGISYSVSQEGDTLYLGEGAYVIIPGISAANYTGGGNGGDGGGGSAGTSTGTTAQTCGVSNVVNSTLTYNSVIDQEGNIYKTIVIGSREWMAENLKTTTYRNGDPIATDLTAAQWSATTTGAWGIYPNTPSLECPYGKLYNYYACTDSRQLCPTGWHVPSDTEWSTLINIFDAGAQGGDNWSNFAGGPLKSTGTTQAGTGFWNGPNTGATNVSGFSGLPGGYILTSGSYANLTLNGYFWTSTESSASNGYARSLYHDPGAIIRTANFGKRTGMSVRCIRD